jgi:hypothetical protein
MSNGYVAGATATDTVPLITYKVRRGGSRIVHELSVPIDRSGGLVSGSTRDSGLRVHSGPEPRPKTGLDHRDRSDWVGGGLHLPQVGLEIVIWAWGKLQTCPTAMVLTITLYAMALSLVVKG